MLICDDLNHINIAVLNYVDCIEISKYDILDNILGGVGSSMLEIEGAARRLNDKSET